MNSPQFTLNKTDYKKIATDAVYFAAPGALVFITTLQLTGDIKMASIAIYTWLLSTVANILRKYTNKP